MDDIDKETKYKGVSPAFNKSTCFFSKLMQLCVRPQIVHIYKRRGKMGNKGETSNVEVGDSEAGLGPQQGRSLEMEGTM